MHTRVRTPIVAAAFALALTQGCDRGEKAAAPPKAPEEMFIVDKSFVIADAPKYAWASQTWSGCAPGRLVGEISTTSNSPLTVKVLISGKQIYEDSGVRLAIDLHVPAGDVETMIQRSSDNPTTVNEKLRIVRE